MDETGPTNQGVVEGEKVEKLEHELEDIEKKAAVPQSAPSPSPPVEPASPPPAPPQPVPSSPPMETAPQGTGKSKVVLWIGIALLVLALVAVGAYYLGSRKTTSTSTPEPTPTQTPTPTPDPTADWKTYEGKEGGFAFKYPADLAATDRRLENIETVTFYASTGDAQLGLECERKITGTSYNPCEAEKVLSVGVANFDKAEYVQPDILKPKTFTDREGKNWTISDTWAAEIGSNFLASVETDSKAYTVTIQAGINGMEKYLRKGLDDATLFSEHEKIAKQILSTFKFIEATPSATITP